MLISFFVNFLNIWKGLGYEGYWRYNCGIEEGVIKINIIYFHLDDD